MATITLTAEPRTLVGKQSDKLRRAGKLPGVLYGHNVKPQNIELNEKEFKKAFKQAGESTIVTLAIEGKNYPVLIQDVQNHYLNDKATHIDFYAVSMTEKLTATIPIHFLGEAPAVKALGGILVKNLSEVEVECLPADLPHAFEVDLTSLNTFEDAVRVSDLKVSDKVKIMAQPDETVVTVAPPRSEEELKELSEKPGVEDVTKVEGVVKPEAPAEGEAAEKPEKAEKKEKE